jgi:tetratricopeptide (TPR) repeat protein
MSDVHELYSSAEKLMDEGQLEGAEARLREVLEADEGFVLGHLALARVYTKLAKYERAVEHARRACELEPKEVFNYTALSVTYQRAWAGTKDPKFIQLAEDARDMAHRLNAR